MKLLFSILFIFLGIITQGQDESFHDKADFFFKTYVTTSGVDYKFIHAHPEVLLPLTDYLRDTPFADLDIDSKKAYFINAYNLLVIKQLSDAYPVNSPMKITGFFDHNNMVLNHEKISLNHLEKKLLFGLDSDPRFHFALVCGAVGCPSLAQFAYDGEDIDGQLESQTTLALNNPNFVRHDRSANTVALSQIFDWYADDFGGKNEVLKYLNKYSEHHYNSSVILTNYEYNWDYNYDSADIVLESEKEVLSDDLEENESDTMELGKEDKEPSKKPSPKVVETEVAQSPTSQSTITPPQPSAPAAPASNVRTYTPSVLLKKGQMDITWFNTIYTQDRSRWMGVEYSGSRETFFTSLLQISHGISKSSRINIGMDFTFGSSGKSSTDEFSKVSRAFDFSNDDSTRVGLSSIGFRVKIAPFKNVSNFSIESSFSIPTTNFSEGRSATNEETGLYFLSWQRYIWWNRFFYDKTFNKFQFFAEGDLLFRIRTNKEQYNALDLPVSAFISYFVSNKSTIYVMGQHVERIRIDDESKALNDAITTPANYSTYGFGGKYQINSKLNLELLYTNFFRSKNAGLGATYNVGLKFIF